MRHVSWNPKSQVFYILIFFFLSLGNCFAQIEGGADGKDYPNMYVSSSGRTIPFNTTFDTLNINLFPYMFPAPL